MKAALATQFGITDYPFGFDVTALSDKTIIYATAMISKFRVFIKTSEVD